MMIQVTTKANLSAATSDSAIQMMDRYYAHRISTGMSTTTKSSFETDCGMAAAACLILSSKVHEIRSLSGIYQIFLLFMCHIFSHFSSIVSSFLLLVLVLSSHQFSIR